MSDARRKLLKLPELLLERWGGGVGLEIEVVVSAPGELGADCAGERAGTTAATVLSRSERVWLKAGLTGVEEVGDPTFGGWSMNRMPQSSRAICALIPLSPSDRCTFVQGAIPGPRK